MKRVARILAIGFAALIGLYVIAGVALQTYLPRCLTHGATLLSSPDGRYVATVDQTICEDRSKSSTQVLIGAPDRKEKLVAAEVPDTVSITLLWLSNSRLQISYPNAPVHDMPGEGWPGVSIRPQAVDDTGRLPGEQR